MDFDFYSNNLFIAHPFCTPSPIIVIGVDTVDLSTVFADAVIYTSDFTEERLRVTSLALTFNWPNPPTAGTTALRFGSTGTVLTLDPANADTTFRAYIYGAWVIVEWVRKETSSGFTVRDTVVRYLLSRDSLESYAAINIDLSAQAAYLESSIVKQGPKRIRRAFWKVGNNYYQLSSPLRIQCGFNMAIQKKEAADNEGFRADIVPDITHPRTTILFNAVPGAGKGKYLKCADYGLLRTINHVPPDDRGNLILAPKDCYWLERPLQAAPTVGGIQVDKTGVPYPNRLQLHNACVECCACEDYENVYRHLRELWEEAQTVSARIYNLLEEYNALRAQLSDVPPLKMTLRAASNFSVGISVMFVNTTASSVISNCRLELRFHLNPSELNGQYSHGSGIMTAPGALETPVDLEGSWPVYSLSIPLYNMPAGGQVVWTGGIRILRHPTYNRGNAMLVSSVRSYIDDVPQDFAAASTTLRSDRG